MNATHFQMGQKVKVAEGSPRAGETAEVVTLPRKQRLYRIRFADGTEASYFYTRLVAC